MKKFLDFCKKPLLRIGIVFVLISSIALIVLACVTNATSPYSYKLSEFGFKLEVTYTLKDGEIYLDMYMDYPGETPEFVTETSNYKIRDRILYVQNVETKEYTRVGKINAYEIEMSYEGQSITLKNKTTNAIKIVAIVLVSVGGVAILSSLAVMYLIKKKEQQPIIQSTQNNEQPTQETPQE